MSLVNMSMVEVKKPLIEARYPFNRSKVLMDAMIDCVTDYYIKADIGGRFEARGITVIGESRQGKSTEIDRLLAKFNDGTTIMPDGRPARIETCLLSGRVTWKDLGIEILGVLGYPLKGRHSQSEIWSKVRKCAELQGVVGIHFDECQHVFTAEDSVTNQKILDSFKSLLKDHNWPLMLIISGIPSLAAHIKKEEQLDRLLRTVSFDGIDLTRETDEEELIHLVFSYAKKADLKFADIDMEDFFSRLAFAACNRWGLVIELLIEAFSRARLSDAEVCDIGHFSTAFANKTGFPEGYSPFTMPNYEDNFDLSKMLQMYEQTRKKNTRRKKSAPK